MKQTTKGLGRGLGALLSSEKIETKINPMSELTEIALSNIEPNPTQPRGEFEEGSIATLADSIKELGVIQPITLRRVGADRYTIISGERRWRAAQIASLTTIPAFVREADDEAMHVMALVENLQREDLNPIEIALGLQRLIDECSLTQEALAQRLTMKRSSISNYLRLLRLGDDVQYALKRGAITMGHAKAIASVESEEGRHMLLMACVERGLSVREAERLAQSYNEGSIEKSAETKKYRVPVGFESLASHLEGIFSKGVEIRSNRSGGGRIVINFANKSEINRLLQGLEIED